MTANIVWHSSAVIDGESFDVQSLVAYCARVSNPNNQHNQATAERLNRYLMRHCHWSPFEMVNICMDISTTRDIARQLLRHKSFSFQEFSQRYATVEQAPRIREARLQDHNNRQNSIAVDDAALQQQWSERQRRIWTECMNEYQWALDNGIAKEVARAILPEGMTWSRLYVNGTLRSWIHYLQVRTDPTTQKEHRDLAQACADEIARVFPSICRIIDPNTDTPRED